MTSTLQSSTQPPSIISILKSKASTTTGSTTTLCNNISISHCHHPNHFRLRIIQINDVYELGDDADEYRVPSAVFCVHTTYNIMQRIIIVTTLTPTIRFHQHHRHHPHYVDVRINDIYRMVVYCHCLLPTYDIDNYGIIVEYSTWTEETKYWKEHTFSQSNDFTNNNTGSQDLVDYLNQMLQTGPERLPSILSANNNHSATTLMGRMATNVLYGIEQMANTIQYGMSMAAQQPTMKNNDVDPSIFHAPPIVERIVSLPYTYPLMCQLPKQQQYTIHNYLALVGDAAHTVHPMAGQGLNLGLQDVMALRDVIMKAKNSGMDVGTYLQEYNTSRQIQVSTTVAAIHGLQQLLCHQQSNGIIGKHMKAFGMNFIQNVKSVRQKIVRAACYGV